MSSQPATDIILASASPRRRELLERVGVRILVVPSTVAEETLPHETPQQHVLRLSRAKALEVAGRAEQAGRWFIGSDTVVVCDGQLLGKPADAGQAEAMLRRLSGRSHQVFSGYTVHDRLGGRTLSDAIATTVDFKRLTAAEIEGYIATGEPFDKAGAYAIQGIGAFMVPRIDGSYANVVGLPLCEVLAALEMLGAGPLFGTPTGT